MIQLAVARRSACRPGSPCVNSPAARSARGTASAYARRLFDARDAGASGHEIRQIIAEGSKGIYFQDGGSRAMGLSDVAIYDIDYLDLDF
ncbi:hypothetical protein GCM10010121_087680 [Streptomyces brasiliensis]|uniref:Uncharacterized protein n=1 Tax=Streptomyces brasiliensis TaxID=1954 RepID=A0A917P641_9ACTN|nr:hypothetical protein GCM10010121_087680 [Streptomyces brasiliensis]